MLITIGVRRWLRGPARFGPDQVVVLDADGDRLRVAEAVRRRVAAGAGVVVVQAGDLVEQEQPAQIGEFRIDRAAEPASRLDSTAPVKPAALNAAASWLSRSPAVADRTASHVLESKNLLNLMTAPFHPFHA